MIAEYIDSVNSSDTYNKGYKPLVPLPPLPGASASKSPKLESPKMSVVSPPKIRTPSPSSPKKEVVSIEELAQLLGGKRKLPKIETKIDKGEKSPIKEKSKSPKDKKNPNAKEKKYCASLDKSKITGDRPAKGKVVYSLDEMKDIARNLKISPTGTKQVLAASILNKMKEIGC
jgi:hypothetical protein